MTENTKLTFSPAYRVYRLFVVVICLFFGLGFDVVWSVLISLGAIVKKRSRSIDIRLLRIEKNY